MPTIDQTQLTGKPTRCLYCDAEIPTEDELTAPKASDDEEWERLAKQHAPDCEWIATRAHRIDA